MRRLTILPLVLLLMSTLLPSAYAQDPAPSPIVFNGQELPTYEAPEGGLVEQIRARGHIYNGVNAANPPFEFVDASGVIVGYDVDLANEFGEWLGVEVATVDTAWDGVIPTLYTGQFDMIWSAMTITDLRKEAVNFSQPYAADQAIWIALATDASVDSLDDLEGKGICTQASSAYEAHAQRVLAEAGVNAEIKSFQDFPTAYLALENGDCAVATSSTLNNLPLNEQRAGVFRNAIVFDEANYVGVATRLPDTDLADAIRTFIDEIKSNGRIEELQTKWFGSPMTLPEST